MARGKENFPKFGYCCHLFVSYTNHFYFTPCLDEHGHMRAHRWYILTYPPDILVNHTARYPQVYVVNSPRSKLLLSYLIEHTLIIIIKESVYLPTRSQKLHPMPTHLLLKSELNNFPEYVIPVSLHLQMQSSENLTDTHLKKRQFKESVRS